MIGERARCINCHMDYQWRDSLLCSRCYDDIGIDLLNDKIPVKNLSKYLMHQDPIVRKWAKKSYERQSSLR